MSVGFARYLYVPEDGTRYSSGVATSIEQALRDAGLATGPDGEGLNWRPFRPTGALMSYAEQLGLVHPTLKIDWSDDPEELNDPYLPPRGPWSRCPTCGKILPTHGTMIAHPLSGEDTLVNIEECVSCGEPFDAYAWDRADDRVIFTTRLVVSLVADNFQAVRPTFQEGCPQFIQTVREVVDHDLREVFVAW
jgi:hypothetical protein